jgi:hypothetical protein
MPHASAAVTLSRVRLPTNRFGSRYSGRTKKRRMASSSGDDVYA